MTDDELFWTIFGAIGTTIGSIATAAAVVVALWQAKFSTKKKLKLHKEKLLNLTEEDYMNDIISQIYINSVICNKKFDNYKAGIKESIIGILSIVLIWGLGIIIY